MPYVIEIAMDLFGVPCQAGKSVDFRSMNIADAGFGCTGREMADWRRLRCLFNGLGDK
jgi:hypothetical protein